jgi:hypothetical protein
VVSAGGGGAFETARAGAGRGTGVIERGAVVDCGGAVDDRGTVDEGGADGGEVGDGGAVIEGGAGIVDGGGRRESSLATSWPSSVPGSASTSSSERTADTGGTLLVAGSSCVAMATFVRIRQRCSAGTLTRYSTTSSSMTTGCGRPVGKAGGFGRIGTTLAGAAGGWDRAMGALEGGLEGG